MDESAVKEFVEGLSKKVGIDTATAEKVVSYVKEQAARLPAILSSLSSSQAAELVKGLAHKLPTTEQAMETVKGLADKLPSTEQAMETVKGLADKLPGGLGTLLGGHGSNKPTDGA